MKNPWLILAVLTLARAAMGFQFQSLAAVGPKLVADTAISFTALGALIGVYLLPGAFLALPGGWLGKRFGDKAMVLTGLVMMSAGGAVLALWEVYEVMLAGRLISGTGAVLLNVLVAKMVTDWFAGRRIVLAMGILISSWPLGIAVALVSMGPLTQWTGLPWASAVPAVVCAIMVLLVALIYSTPEHAQRGDGIPGGTEARYGSRFELWAAVASGFVWCFYNVAFILTLSFGPEFLTGRGMTLAAAGAIVSLTSWLIIPALPAGGWLAEYLGRPVRTMVVNFTLIAVIVWMIPVTSSYVLVFAVLGLVFGPAGGLIMALPSQVLSSGNRAVGMGLFFTVYYIGMGVFPAVAGYIRDASGEPAAPLWLAGFMILAAMAALLAFRMLVNRMSTAARPRSAAARA